MFFQNLFYFAIPASHKSPQYGQKIEDKFTLSLNPRCRTNVAFIPFAFFFWIYQNFLFQKKFFHICKTKENKKKAWSARYLLHKAWKCPKYLLHIAKKLTSLWQRILDCICSAWILGYLESNIWMGPKLKGHEPPPNVHHLSQSSWALSLEKLDRAN